MRAPKLPKISYRVTKITDHVGSIRFEVMDSTTYKDREKEIKGSYKEAMEAYKKDKSGEKPKMPRILLVRKFKDASDARKLANELSLKELEKDNKNKE